MIFLRSQTMFVTVSISYYSSLKFTKLLLLKNMSSYVIVHIHHDVTHIYYCSYSPWCHTHILLFMFTIMSHMMSCWYTRVPKLAVYAYVAWGVLEFSGQSECLALVVVVVATVTDTQNGQQLLG